MTAYYKKQHYYTRNAPDKMQHAARLEFAESPDAYPHQKAAHPLVMDSMC